MNVNTIDAQIADCKFQLAKPDLDKDLRNLYEKELARLEKEENEFWERNQGFEELGHSNSAVGDLFNADN